MLSSCSAEAVQRVASDVIAALDADFLNRIRHVLDRDTQEPFGGILGGLRRCVCLLGNLRREALKFCAHDRGIKRLIRHSDQTQAENDPD